MLLGLFLGPSALLGQQHCLDVGQDSTLGNGNTSKELVRLLIIPEMYKVKDSNARVTDT